MLDFLLLGCSVAYSSHGIFSGFVRCPGMIASHTTGQDQSGSRKGNGTSFPWVMQKIGSTKTL